MSKRPFKRIEGTTFKRYGPGEEVQTIDFNPGDFILTHGNTKISKLIRLGQKIRFRGAEEKYSWWNHAALIVSEKGDLIEALGAGVRETNISKYKPTEYHLVQLGTIATGNDREEVVKFAKSSVGLPYGRLTIISIALSLLTGCKLTFGFDEQSICSGLVARALERTSIIFSRTPSHILPADLAKYFGIEAPEPGTNKGQIPRLQRKKKQKLTRVECR
jgi:hypothetical protein